MLGKVTLTSKELQMAITEAGFRHLRGLKGLRQGSGYTWDMKAMGMDVQGVAGEIAFCKLMNLYWNPGSGPSPLADIGPYQIKTTHYPDGKLVIVPNCHNDICVLMVGAEASFRCAGWIGAEAGRVQAFHYSLEAHRPPTYNVPQNFLEPFSTIPR